MQSLCAALTVMFSLGVGACGGHPKHIINSGYATYTDQVEYEAAVRISAMCLDGSVRYGSGVAITPRHVVTAKHVIDCKGEDAIVVTVIKIDQTQVDMIVEKRSSSDAALLMVAGSSSPFKFYAPIRHTLAKRGEEVCIVAGQYLEEYALKRCGIAGITTSELGTWVSIHAIPGNSGGPAYDNSGNLLGILTRGKWRSDGEFIGIVLPVKEFEDILIAPVHSPNTGGCSGANCK